MSTNFSRSLGSCGIAALFVLSSANAVWAETPYEVQQVQLIGSAGFDSLSDILIDTQGHLFISGSTDGTFYDNTNLGGYDFALAKLDATGQKIWSQQYGTEYRESGGALAMDTLGNIYISAGDGGLVMLMCY